MLISLDHLRLNVRGVLHVGAHDCEELPLYRDKWGLTDNQILWIDANPDKKVPYCHAISDRDGERRAFHISNNLQSSSLLEFGTHRAEHPEVEYTHSIEVETITLDTFFDTYRLDPKQYNFWNLDIQGAELLALKGGTRALQYADWVYLEVNIKELYKGCALLPEVDLFLEAAGFQRTHTALTEHGWGDALYARSTVRI